MEWQETTTALAGIGAVVIAAMAAAVSSVLSHRTASYAKKIADIESHRDTERAEEDRRKQANLIAAWVGAQEEDPRRKAIHVVNASHLPIFDVAPRALWRDPSAGNTAAPKEVDTPLYAPPESTEPFAPRRGRIEPVIPPLAAWQFLIETEENDLMEGVRPTAVLRFTDAAGNRWHKTSGTLDIDGRQ